MFEFFDLIGKVSDLFFWIIGIVLLIVAFAIGGFFGFWVRVFGHAIGSRFPLNLNRSITDLVLRGIVILITVILCSLVKLPFGEILSSIIPVGSFGDISQDMLGNTDHFVTSNIISTGWNQLIMAFVSFFPIFVITEVIGAIKTVICKPNDEPFYGYISFIPEFLTVLSANAILMVTGDLLPRMQLAFISSIKVQFGFIRFILLALVLFIYIYYVIKDMLGTDVFITMMSANIAAAILSADLAGQPRTIIIILTMVLGYVSKLVRHFVSVRLHFDNEYASFIFTPIYGLISLIVSCIIFIVIIKLMGI